jgi:predicted GNAT family N-acyltransferase
MPRVIQINMQNPLYQKERRLRNRILLNPIGIPDFGWEMNDPISWHFIAVEKGELIGCVLLTPLEHEKNSAQLMQMAVETNWQGKGVGKLLVDALISFAEAQGFKCIEIHSRSNVIGFYTRLGFETVGEEFVEVGIKHRYMRRYLSQ